MYVYSYVCTYVFSISDNQKKWCTHISPQLGMFYNEKNGLDSPRLLKRFVGFVVRRSICRIRIRRRAEGE
jgi:hypothetical protein